jgi:hypothetical protein
MLLMQMVVQHADVNQVLVKMDKLRWQVTFAVAVLTNKIVHQLTNVLLHPMMLMLFVVLVVNKL